VRAKTPLLFDDKPLSEEVLSGELSVENLERVGSPDVYHTSEQFSQRNLEGDTDANDTQSELPELTIRSFILVMIFSTVLGSANAYLGLFAGMTISVSIHPVRDPLASGSQVHPLVLDSEKERGGEYL
jgi:hypothetical protein